MGFKNNNFCTLWCVDKDTKKVVALADKYADIQVSTSKKNAQGQYETDFSGRVRCLGKAFEKIKEYALREKDKIKLLEVETTNKYVADRRQTYTNFLCWDLEVLDTKDKTPRQPDVVDNPEMTPFDPIDSMDTLPF